MEKSPDLTKLVPNLEGAVDLKDRFLIFTGIDPDDAFSSVPYEKGFNFLFYLEGILGEENFAVLLKEWLKKYAQITANSEDWKKVSLVNFKWF